MGDIALSGGSGGSGLMAYTTDESGGGEQYCVTVVDIRGATKRRLWTSGSPAGPAGIAPRVAVLGTRLWFIEADTPLQYRRLVSVEAATGKDRRVEYEETDPEASLSLEPGLRTCLFLTVDRPSWKALFHIAATGEVRRLTPEGWLFAPVGALKASGEPAYFVRLAGAESGWQGRGPGLEGVELPRDLSKGGIEATFHDGKALVVVVRRQGMRHFVRVNTRGDVTGHPKAVVLGACHVNPWRCWLGQAPEVYVTMPGAPPVRLRTALPFQLGPPRSMYGSATQTGFARSADGRHVRWVVRIPTGRPRGLIVVAYGAYGLSTSLSTARWKPYLERGVAVGFAMVRGGGDDGEEWAAAGRRAGKKGGVEDLEACVAALRRFTGVGAEATCLYGRSAGGYLVGAAVARAAAAAAGAAGARTPSLFRLAYTEVPYVDVLRTAGRSDLPLTSLEYDEFGDPARRIEDVEAMLRLSPVHALGPAGAPGISVICRTGLRDRQVYAYEAVKWVDALRGAGGTSSKGKVLGVSTQQGHFTVGEHLSLERTEDFLILTQKMLGAE